MAEELTLEELTLAPNAQRVRMNEGCEVEMVRSTSGKLVQKLDAKKKVVWKLDEKKQRIPIPFEPTKLGKDGKLNPKMDIGDFGSFRLEDHSACCAHLKDGNPLCKEGKVRHITPDPQEIVDVYRDNFKNGWLIYPVDPRAWQDARREENPLFLRAASPEAKTGPKMIR